MEEGLLKRERVEDRGNAIYRALVAMANMGAQVATQAK